MENQGVNNPFKDSRTNWKFIWIVVIFGFLAGSGILGYYYLRIAELEAKLAVLEVRLPKVKAPEEVAPEEEVNEPEGEVVGQLTADLKETGWPQLVTLVMKPSGEEFSPFYFVRIYTDQAGQVIEWEGASMQGLVPGNILTVHNSATDRLTIQHTEGAGAHGSISQFIHWTGSRFEEIKAIDEDGQPISNPWFGDGGGAVLSADGKILVGFRNYDCPLSASITHIYEWNGEAYQLVRKDIDECPEF